MIVFIFVSFEFWIFGVNSVVHQLSTSWKWRYNYHSNYNYNSIEHQNETYRVYMT